MDFIPEILGKLKVALKDKRENELFKLYDDNSVGNLLEMCYLASLITDEDRYPSFRVQIIKQDDPPHTAFSIKFNEEKALSPKSLNRISFASSIGETAIGVILKNGNWHIWGLVVEPDLNDKLTEKAIPRGAGLKHVLEIVVQQPGDLIIRKYYTELLRYHIGTTYTFRKFKDLNIIRDYTAGLLPNFLTLCNEHISWDYFLENFRFDDEMAQTVLIHYLGGLLKRISDLRHGGMIIFTNSEDYRGVGKSTFLESNLVSNALSGFIACQQSFYHLNDPDGGLAKKAEKPDNANIFQIIRNGTQTRMRLFRTDVVNSLYQISHLSFVDGAVILNEILDAIRLGAEITVREEDIDCQLETVAVIKADNSREDMDITEKGTRHRSAFRFAAVNPDAIVAVISQDGPISVVKRVGDEVHVWVDVST